MIASTAVILLAGCGQEMRQGELPQQEPPVQVHIDGDPHAQKLSAEIDVGQAVNVNLEDLVIKSSKAENPTENIIEAVTRLEKVAAPSQADLLQADAPKSDEVAVSGKGDRPTTDIAEVVTEIEGTGAETEMVTIQHVSDNNTQIRSSILYVRYPGQVFFNTDNVEIRPESNSVVDKLAHTLQSAGRNWLVTVIGHTDSRGSDEYNMTLATGRANATVYALAERGINPHRLRIAAAGERQPISTNETPNGRALNRRVEFLIGETPDAHNAFIQQTHINRDFQNNHQNAREMEVIPDEVEIQTLIDKIAGGVPKSIAFREPYVPIEWKYEFLEIEFLGLEN